jgi:hypothetical protein
MRHQIISVGILLVTSFLQAGGQRVYVPITNGSFEQTTAPIWGTDPCGTSGYTAPTLGFFIPGWTWQSGTGVLQPTQPNSCGIPPPPDGSTWAYVQNATIYNDLGVTPASLQAGHRDGLYILEFYVVNYFQSYPGYYTAMITFGTQELCKAEGWGRGSVTHVIAVCASPGYIVRDASLEENGTPGPVQGGSNLVLSFRAQGWELLTDDYSLAFRATD